MAFPVYIKDPNAVMTFHVIWCSLDGTNDASASDTGVLQSATISGSTWTVPTGITKDADDTASKTMRGVTYGINTIANITLSSGTAGTEYTIVNRITTSAGETLDKSFIVRVQEE